MADPKTRWHTSKIISQLLLHDKGSLQCAKSPITYGFKVFVFLLAKRSHNNPNLGLAKIWHQILRPLSGQFIWTRKKDPAVMCWAQDPGDLIQLGKTVPRVFVVVTKIARHQSPWFLKEGMKENTGIPHRCLNTYGQLMTRQKCQVKFLVGDWQKGVIKKSPELSNYSHSYGPPKRGFLESSDYVQWLITISNFLLQFLPKWCVHLGFLCIFK